MRIEALGHRIDAVETRVDDMSVGQDRLIGAVDKLVAQVGEFNLKAVDSEGVKVREEQKTKRWIALIGLLTMVIAPLGTVTANYLTKDTAPPQKTEIIQSAMQNELDACKKAPSDQAWAECIRDTSIRNAPQRIH